MKIDIPYQVSDYEYLEGYHYINGDVREILMPKGMLILASLVGIGVLVLVYLNIWIGIFWLAIVFIFYFFIFTRYYIVRRKAKKGVALSTNCNLVISDKQIEFYRGEDNVVYPWDSFIKYYNGDRVLLLFLSEREFVTIPKRLLDVNEPTIFDIIKNHIDEKK